MYFIDKNNFAIITEKIRNKISQELLQAFEYQLNQEKGFVMHNFGSQGVKNLDKYSSEIKISNNPRLMSEKIKNKNKKILHIFCKLDKKPHKN